MIVFEYILGLIVLRIHFVIVVMIKIIKEIVLKTFYQLIINFVFFA